MKTIYFYLLLHIILPAFSTISLATGQTNEYRFHAMFIYNFTKYLQWPTSSAKANEFVIGIIGESEIMPELEKATLNKLASGQKIIIKKFSSVSEVSECNIIFVPEKQSKSMTDLLAKTQNTSTVIITEQPGMARKGSMINFIIRDSRWRFEINRTAAQEANIKVSGELLKLAILVE